MLLCSRIAPLAALLLQVAATPAARSHSNPIRNLHTRYAPDHHGAVASESSICSKIGINLLTQGGNAADAMVGTVFCIGVVAMYHSGVGGGGFMLVRAPNGTFETIDFRETAPAAAFQDMYNNNTNLSIYGGLASGVPGEVRGLARLHQSYGQLPWSTVMQGAINASRYGVPVTEDLVRYMKSAEASAQVPDFLVSDPNWAVDFAPNGTLVGLGDTITRKRYANTLQTISEQGPDAFYTGEIANYTIAALQAAGGTMTLEDLANYTAAVRLSTNITYRNYTLHSTSAPSSGAIVLSTLNIVSGYGDFFQPDNLDNSTYLLDEGMRFAYGQRTEFGDPSFVANLSLLQDEILLPQTGADIRARINFTHTLNVSAYDPSGFESLVTPGTSEIATADASGLAVSLTTTVNLLFGSQLIVPETGVIMNNEMNDFSIPGSSNAFGYIPSPANYIRPGKRPLSSISPTIAQNSNGSLYFVTGSAGGSRIITANIQNLVHVLDQGMTAPEALAQPRLHDQLVPNVVSFEYAYDNATVAYLQSTGLNVSWTAPGGSTAQAIRLLPNGTFEAAGEPRQLNSGGYAV